jgi:2-polyprenyl-6-methoxyphenol hydroxylase-like FAD-dependent oxidoreductase
VSGIDVLVIGAGPAGASTAQRLAREGLCVMLVEKSEFPRRKVCGEFISAPTWPLLESLGVAEALSAHAGPPVQRVGFFAGETVLDSPMPAGKGAPRWGCALGRHVLDAELLQAATRSGAQLRQPAAVTAIARQGGYQLVTLESGRGRHETVLARAVVDCHGSWERMPGEERAARPSDLLGFKARFAGARLATGLMPLVLFPGGYGGLVESDSGLVSFSCCIRRDTLRAIRPGHGSAGEAVRGHAMRHCRGLREALDGARLERAWLAAGPIRPGIRPLHRDGLFRAGNAAGEAHPLIAEGITMAIQSGFLLAQNLAAAGGLSDRALAEAGREYERAWRTQFASRVRASRAFATLTLSPVAADVSRVLLRRIPSALTLGALFSGKARPLSAMETGA